MGKGILKSKVLAFLAAGGIIIGPFFALCGGAGKVHVYSQNFNREHLKVEDFSDEADFQAAKEEYQDEADRVEPKANGMLITSAVSFVVGGVSFVGFEIDSKKRNREENPKELLGIDEGFAGTL